MVFDGGIGADDVRRRLLWTGSVVIVEVLCRTLERYRDAFRGQCSLLLFIFLLRLIPELVVIAVKTDEYHILFTTRRSTWL